MSEGHSIVCPIDVQHVLPQLDAFEFYDMIRILVKIRCGVFIPKGWEKTKIGKAEIEFARLFRKKIRYESKQKSLQKQVGEIWNE
jgi:hypothetical protein